MQLMNINGNRLDMYDSITELPVLNFHEFNRNLIIDAGIGSDMEAIDAKLARLSRLIQSDKKEAALTDIMNIRTGLYMILNGISPKMRAFIAMIKTLNGEAVTNYSEENVQRITKELHRKGLTIGKVKGFLSMAKKKRNRN